MKQFNKINIPWPHIFFVLETKLKIMMIHHRLVSKIYFQMLVIIKIFCFIYFVSYTFLNHIFNSDVCIQMVIFLLTHVSNVSEFCTSGFSKKPQQQVYKMNTCSDNLYRQCRWLKITLIWSKYACKQANVCPRCRFGWEKIWFVG